MLVLEAFCLRSLWEEEQKYANIFLHDIQRGDVVPESGKTMRDYITEYLARAKNNEQHKLVEVLGIDEVLLSKFMELDVTEENINEYGRLEALKRTVDKAKAKAYFEALEGAKLIAPKVMQKADKLLRKFIFDGGCEIKMP